MGFSNLTPENAEDWFRLQSRWTIDLREYICRKIKVRRFSKFLELGSGTGTILKYFHEKCGHGEFIGVEKDLSLAEFASKKYPELKIKSSDSLSYLKKINEKFDVIFSHFYFIWDENYQHVLREVRKHLNKEGFFLILAEPDYGGVLESPEPIRSDLDIKSIINFNGDPFIGRKIPVEINKAGFKTVENGLISKLKANLFPARNEFLEEFRFYKQFWDEFESKEESKKVEDKILGYIEKGEYFYFLPIMYFILRP